MNTYNPSEFEIEEIYRSLDNFTSIIFKIDKAKLLEKCDALERCGFIGFKLVKDIKQVEVFRIKVWKGKHGPCYDTDRSILYKGKALAVIDDDLHIFIRDLKQPVCEKTAQVHLLEPYKESQVSDNTQNNSNNMPKAFDCDDLDELTQKLIKSIDTSNEKTKSIGMFYSGPYKMMVLNDGSVLRRGLVNKISIKWIGICKEEGGLECELNDLSETVFFNIKILNESLDDFGKKYAQINPPHEVRELNLRACDNIMPKFKTKLLKVIENKQPYFLLTGSDPVDQLGCCPSEEVGSANLLVNEGILNKIQAEESIENCPVQIYAFRNEIVGSENFLIDEDFRGLVKERLLVKKKTTVVVMRILLLIIVICSLLIGVTHEFSQGNTQKCELADLTQAKKGLSYHLILLHATKRCEMCLNMESFTKEFQIKKHAVQEIQFVMSNMDRKELQFIVDENNIFTSTMFLLVKQDDRVIYQKLLKDLWEHYKSKIAFQEILQKEMEASGYPK